MTASTSGSETISEILLEWYDRHARALPWRVPPNSGERPDPYRVWLSEVMLQQTTTAHAAPYFRAFTERWPTVGALAAAPEAEVMAAWAGLGYYSRARNLIACAREVAAMGGFPKTATELRKLPGIGAYTSSAIAAIAFGEAAPAVDTNIARVLSRFHALPEPSRASLEDRMSGIVAAGPPGDVVQAMMDLGATICVPAQP